MKEKLLRLLRMYQNKKFAPGEHVYDRFARVICDIAQEAGYVIRPKDRNMCFAGFRAERSWSGDFRNAVSHEKWFVYFWGNGQRVEIELSSDSRVLRSSREIAPGPR